ncbi:MAG: leucine-rich repeat protein [Mycoplasmoidaceae bacterium]|nr:leucine-rich repeat protein [Mycoplasmoidaceae bacterium]
MTSINLPNNLTAIGQNVFYSCSNLNKIS